jgi:GntR family transcriptional regulator
VSPPRFPYQQIASDLRQAILGGHLAPGDRLPRQDELAEQYKTTRPTVRRALEQLIIEGLIASEQGRGAFVRPKPRLYLRQTGPAFRQQRASGRTNLTAEAASQGQQIEQRLLMVGRIVPPPDVAQLLDVDDDTEVVIRRRLVLLEGRPAQLQASYYPLELAEGTALAEPRRIRGGAFAVIEDPAGPIARTVVRFVEDVWVRMPTGPEADELDLPRAAAIARTLRTAYDGRDVALEVLDSVIAGDRHVLHYEIAVPPR